MIKPCFSIFGFLLLFYFAPVSGWGQGRILDEITISADRSQFFYSDTEGGVGPNYGLALNVSRYWMADNSPNLFGASSFQISTDLGLRHEAVFVPISKPHVFLDFAIGVSFNWEGFQVRARVFRAQRFSPDRSSPPILGVGEQKSGYYGLGILAHLFFSSKWYFRAEWNPLSSPLYTDYWSNGLQCDCSNRRINYLAIGITHRISRF